MDKTIAGKKAILVIEDNAAIAEIIKDTLNAEPDYQAVAVHDGLLAVEVVQSLRASLVLLDLSLPGMDGLQVYDMLKADENTSAVPVIFVTANSQRADFRKRGFSNVIQKPFDLDELLARVNEVLHPD
jgi:DNA-binding response OmpR family regulator